jgi:acetyltransferase-like isoleucine patch superfamily enzyme
MHSLVITLKRRLSYAPLGLLIMNFVVQRLFRVNGRCGYSVHYTSQVRQPDKLQLSSTAARSLTLMSHCNIQAGNGISIGRRSFFASGLTLISANHDPHDLIAGDPVLASPITIGEDCWIGANVTILPGVSLGDSVIVGAGSVVTKSFPSRSVIAGNPARIILNSKLINYGRNVSLSER